MSKAILKKEIDLFKEDLSCNAGKTEKITGKKMTHKDPMRRITTNKKGVKKELKKLKCQPLHKLPAIIKKQKLAVEESYKYRKEDKTHSNLTFLEKLKKLDSTPSSTVNKILVHNKGNLSKNKPQDDSEKEEKSIFSDNDFDKFEKEYDWWAEKY